MLYQKPTLEILQTETGDVICASNGGTYEGGNDSPVGGPWVTPTN